MGYTDLLLVVEHLNTMNLNITFTMTFISYSYIIRLVRYLGDEI